MLLCRPRNPQFSDRPPSIVLWFSLSIQHFKFEQHVGKVFTLSA